MKEDVVRFCKQHGYQLIGVFVICIALILVIPFIYTTIPAADDENCIVTNYTECSNDNVMEKSCYDTLKNNDATSCKCNMTLNVNHDMLGDVTVYYQLDSYNQTEQNYSSSRDDEQLSGHISPEPSQACGQFSRSTNGRPILPCGEVADSMFTDSYKLEYKNEVVQVVTTGLVNKTGYRNPPANLTEVFEDFNKPTHWDKNIWELDPQNPENNGFQNEAFIAWMRTDLKIKPVFWLKQQGRFEKGLPIGMYRIYIKYVYPLASYNGSRILFVCAKEDCIQIDYTNCSNRENLRETCFDAIKYVKECVCVMNLNVTHDMAGKIIVYYKLDSYNQLDPSYVNSRDDDQLSGKLTRNPSSNCEPYALRDGKPIAPCGKVADTMFTDTFRLILDNDYLDVETTGLVNKTGYQNPPANPTKAFKDFEKPKNWLKNVWELDPENPDNNGVQNEAFIAWMRTDLKRKPAWRLKRAGRYKDGLPSGLYNILISYEYPVKRYEGSRLLFVCGKRHIPETVKTRVLPVVLLIILVVLGVGIASFKYIKEFMIKTGICHETNELPHIEDYADHGLVAQSSPASS